MKKSSHQNYEKNMRKTIIRPCFLQKNELALVFVEFPDRIAGCEPLLFVSSVFFIFLQMINDII